MPKPTRHHTNDDKYYLSKNSLFVVTSFLSGRSSHHFFGHQKQFRLRGGFGLNFTDLQFQFCVQTRAGIPPLSRTGICPLHTKDQKTPGHNRPCNTFLSHGHPYICTATHSRSSEVHKTLQTFIEELLLKAKFEILAAKQISVHLPQPVTQFFIQSDPNHNKHYRQAIGKQADIVFKLRNLDPKS